MMAPIDSAEGCARPLRATLGAVWDLASVSAPLPSAPEFYVAALERAPALSAAVTPPAPPAMPQVTLVPARLPPPRVALSLGFRRHATWSERSLLFNRPISREGFHLQILFGLGGGPENEGLFHAMELGGTLPNGVTLAMLHTFVQNRGILGPERGPDLVGGWLAEVKVPVLFPELEVKFALGLGGLHDQSNGLRAIPGFGWAYGVDLHLPFYRRMGLTLGLTFIHALVPQHYMTVGVGLGFTVF